MRTEFFKDTFVFDVGEKQWLRATGSGPSARSGHHSCIVGRTMYTFGGEFCNAKVGISTCDTVLHPHAPQCDSAS